MTKQPFAIRDDKRRALKRFGTYAEAERAASKRCRALRVCVPVYRHRTHISTVQPGAGAGLLVFLTTAGSKII
ncbi:hypothetical protein [Asaia sp. HN010]|uniref:hypothetical protein n=1 Tax=Asaia sp. HN010 TaxID=3081233 RepID=UPI00301A146C